MANESIDIFNYVIMGHYQRGSKYFSEITLNQFVSKVFREIYPQIFKTSQMNYEWTNTKKVASDSYYLSLLYHCASTMIDYFQIPSMEERQMKSILWFTADILEYVKAAVVKLPYKQEGPKPWMRLGNVYRLLKEYDKAFMTYNEGIVYLTKQTNWIIGDIAEMELISGNPSMNEWLYASEGRCLYEMGQKNNAKEAIEIALRSLSKRGKEDLIDFHFPNGIRIYLK